jgi:MFS family permease
MATTEMAPGTFSDSEHTKQLRRAIIASTVGTAIEWYDFFLYGAVTAIVFAKLYFPNSDPLAGTLSSFGIYAVGFVARPVGAAIFGHYGDRIGRKATLIATLMLMGIATFLVGFVPSYDSIGIWGAEGARRIIRSVTPVSPRLYRPFSPRGSRAALVGRPCCRGLSDVPSPH